MPMRKILSVIWILVFYTNGMCYDFSKVDELVLKGISDKYYPGAALIIGLNQDVLYEKYYGGFTYDENSSGVTENSIFDLASVTKVIATTSAIMKLYDKGLIELDSKVTDYLPEFGASGKDNVTVRNLLVHNSGLKAWMPFYKTCSNKKDVANTIFSAGLEFDPGTTFLYSDLNMITLMLIIEKVSGESFSDFCGNEIFYQLGLKNTMFNPPAEKKSNIVPTEYDANLRKRQLQGEVHDENAFVIGGASGHAGLFSTAEDLFKFMRMMLNEGKYNNPYTRGIKEESMFKKETVELFLNRYYTQDYMNTRALGWDTKQDPVGKYRSQCGELISANCFGHTGYTGTSVWCDRDRGITIVFLTNRVYPSRDINGIKEVRPELHNLIIKTLTNK